MTNEERISIFVKEIEKEALGKKEQIIKDSEHRITAIFESGKPAIDAEAELYFRNECNRILSENAQGVAKDNAESRRSIIAKRNELTDTVFDEVVTKLDTFTNSDEYKKYILSAYEKIVGEFSQPVCIFARDCDLDTVKSVIPCEVFADKNIRYGGIKAKISDTAVIDFTFDTKITAERREFASKSGLIVI